MAEGAPDTGTYGLSPTRYYGCASWSAVLDEDHTIWDWLDQINAEGGTGYAGHNDWRISNVRELLSIVDYGEFDPAFKPIFGFDSFRCFWSSTTSAADPSDAWIVCFGRGQSDGSIDGNKTYGNSIRAVRGGPSVRIKIPKVPLLD